MDTSNWFGAHPAVKKISHRVPRTLIFPNEVMSSSPTVFAAKSHVLGAGISWKPGFVRSQVIISYSACFLGPSLAKNQLAALPAADFNKDSTARPVDLLVQRPNGECPADALPFADRESDRH